ncbi:hypothetical protein AWENTII_006665 [Aspergillus wentii]
MIRRSGGSQKTRRRFLILPEFGEGKSLDALRVFGQTCSCVFTAYDTKYVHTQSQCEQVLNDTGNQAPPRPNGIPVQADSGQDWSVDLK